jgi:FMN phosphatase YigB (HAD superfamily)
MNHYHKIIFVDFDGVLCYEPFWQSLKNNSHEFHVYFELIGKLLFKDDKSIINDWMIGKYNSEDVHKIISEKIGIPYDFLFNIFKNDCKNMKISVKILKQLLKLKKEYYLILSTGNMDAFDRFILPSNPMIESVFDEVHNSYNLKLLKSSNNGQYFVNVIKEKETSFADCCLIDDSISTCRIFEDHGGKAFCVKGESEVLRYLSVL